MSKKCDEDVDFPSPRWIILGGILCVVLMLVRSYMKSLFSLDSRSFFGIISFGICLLPLLAGLEFARKQSVRECITFSLGFIGSWVFFVWGLHALLSTDVMTPLRECLFISKSDTLSASNLLFVILLPLYYRIRARFKNENQEEQEQRSES